MEVSDEYGENCFADVKDDASSLTRLIDQDVTATNERRSELVSG